MIKRQLKKPVLYAIYGLSVLSVMGSIYLLETNNNSEKPKENNNQNYVEKPIFEQEIPVVNIEKRINRPYVDAEIKIVKNYYDYQGEAPEQQNAIIYYDNTYLQNSGICYGGKETFDITAILDGTVIKVTNDDLLGGIIEIRHDNELISIYQSVSEISVQENTQVTQGQIIGKAGPSNISKELNNHLHFELILRGQIVNPENYYDKTLNEI